MVEAQHIAISAQRIDEFLPQQSHRRRAENDDTLLVQPKWVETASFSGFTLIEVDPEEEHAANILRIGDVAVMPASFPRTAQKLRDAGFEVVTVDVSELQKAEGATTCCSLVFNEATAAR